MIDPRTSVIEKRMSQIGRILGFESGVNIVNAGLSDPAFNRTVNITPLDLFRFNTEEGKADFTNAVRQLDPRDPGQVFYAFYPAHLLALHFYDLYGS